METDKQALSIFERFNRWVQESIMVKLFSIGFLILILLIPTAWITSIMEEREQRADEAIDEVADKWAGPQTISGPILVVPYLRTVKSSGEGQPTEERIERAFFLPAELNIDGSLQPQVLHRGIFDVAVYESTLTLRSVFSAPDFKSLSIDDDKIVWKDAYLVLGITDLRGIKDSLVVTAGGTPLEAEPSSNIGVSIIKTPRPDRDYRPRPVSPEALTHGITVKGGMQVAAGFPKEAVIKLNLKGSRRIDFLPVGKTTTVKLNGTWSNPSFDGEFLPSSRELSKDSFSATWKILHFNRPFPQQWTENEQRLSAADFGVKLLVPVDQYQKSIRTAKYGVLIILLTFMALFLVEITQKIRIHPFQYILIGAALIIYYSLLLSLSEHVGYNLAYILASAATVTLVTLYSRTFFHQSRLMWLFAFLLAVFYAFIYVIILQQDYSLLIGSIGLFIIVGMLMYFSRKVNWYETPTTP